MEHSIIVDNISKKFDINKLKKETQFREALVNYFKRTFSKGQKNNEELWALKNISFSVKKGEIVGIIGRNGAGKSTLLKILSKITYPTSGEVKVNGRVGSLLEVGTGFHEELSGRENIYLNGSILGMRKKEVQQKIDEIVSFSEVEKFLDTPIKRYSSGMRLKLGFSVAAHLDTEILFIDEVLAVGDVAFQRKCLDKIKELCHSGRTVIFVSHSMVAVEHLCPRALWIDNGELVQDDRTGDVIKKYMEVVRGKFSADFKTAEIPGLEHPTIFDLTPATNREGSGEIRFTRIEYLDLDGQAKSTIRSGDSMKVRLFFQVNKTFTKPEFYFRIRNEFGEKVTTLSPFLSGNEMTTLHPGNGYVDVDIKFLNLMPDRYYITIYILVESGKIDKNLVDGIEHAATLDVEVSNYYNSDRGIDKWWGVLFLPCEWNLNGMSDCSTALDQLQTEKTI
jgi:lipopolysaccharide transport system ATP-binding protein